MPRLTEQILFLSVFGSRLLPELGNVLANPKTYGLFLPAGQRAVQRALQRMTTRGEMRCVGHGKNQRYQVTAVGRGRVGSVWPHLSSKLKIQPFDLAQGKNSTFTGNEWDKKWRVVVFDIPERYRGLRAILRRFLISVGFVGMQRSLWISPFAVAGEVKAFLEASRLDQMTILMEVDTLWGVATQDLIERTWKVGALGEKYRAFGVACGVAPGLTQGLRQQFARLVFGDSWLPADLVKEDLGRRQAMEAYGRLVEKTA